MAHTWQKNDYDDQPNLFAGVDHGFHNGPLCTTCGFSFCLHCNPEAWDSPCPCPAGSVAPDDDKLDSAVVAIFGRP